ncbi:DUF1566 domain-containing protein [candidate division KSB1 bacterium]|nr:DUF1566 domain-containing protein [candidate division KSB1 bacterium]
MAKIFLCHANDDIDSADEISDQILADELGEIWYSDLSDYDDENLHEKLVEGIEWCNVFLLLWSRNAALSPEVMFEWTHALNLRCRIIICQFDNFRLPGVLSAKEKVPFTSFNSGYQTLRQLLSDGKIKDRPITSGKSVAKPREDKLSGTKNKTETAPAEKLIIKDKEVAKTASQKIPAEEPTLREEDIPTVTKVNLAKIIEEKATPVSPKPKIEKTGKEKKEPVQAIAAKSILSKPDAKAMPASSVHLEPAQLDKSGEFKANIRRFRLEIVIPAIIVFVLIGLIIFTLFQKRAEASRLRSQPVVLTEENVIQMIQAHHFYAQDWNDSGQGYDNEFVIEDRKGAKVVIDKKSHLTWEQAGSSKELTTAAAMSYIAELNKTRFAGYADWRLPTLEEAMTLMQPYKNQQDMHLEPIFESRWCIWTADTDKYQQHWALNFFNRPQVNSDAEFYVRACR